MPAAIVRDLVARQDIQGAVDGVRNSFSSWDSCMAKAYCKWPVIVGIVVGSLIILSIIFCCVRCLCCGVECCCGICSCFNACCPSPRGRGGKKSYDEPPYRPVGPPQQPYHAQYQSHGPPSYATPSYNYGQPQYAQFDVSKPKNPDALPSMPSWDGAENRKVEVRDDPSDNVEMNDLDQHGRKPGTADSRSPMMAGFAAAGHGRPGADSATGGQDPYGRQSPHEQRGLYANEPPSFYNDRQSHLSADSHNSAGHYQGAGDGYGGAATGGYRGAAPAPQQYGPPHGKYSGEFSYGAAPQFEEQQRQQDHYPQPQQQPQPSYQAFSPQTASSAPTPAYPGQRAYQSSPGPVSPISPQHMGYGSHSVEPSLDYPDRFRPQQELRDSNPSGHGWQGAAPGAAPGRKPVEGSWRDI